MTKFSSDGQLLMHVTGICFTTKVPLKPVDMSGRRLVDPLLIYLYLTYKFLHYLKPKLCFVSDQKRNCVSFSAWKHFAQAAYLTAVQFLADRYLAIVAPSPPLTRIRALRRRLGLIPVAAHFDAVTLARTELSVGGGPHILGSPSS
jgi:hypothetical protein